MGQVRKSEKRPKAEEEARVRSHFGDGMPMAGTTRPVAVWWRAVPGGAHISQGGVPAPAAPQALARQPMGCDGEGGHGLDRRGRADAQRGPSCLHRHRHMPLAAHRHDENQP